MFIEKNGSRICSFDLDNIFVNLTHSSQNNLQLFAYALCIHSHSVVVWVVSEWVFFLCAFQKFVPCFGWLTTEFQINGILFFNSNSICDFLHSVAIKTFITYIRGRVWSEGDWGGGTSNGRYYMCAGMANVDNNIHDAKNH